MKWLRIKIPQRQQESDPRTTHNGHKPTKTKRERQDKRLKKLIAEASEDTIKSLTHVVKAHLATTQEERERHLKQVFAICPDVSPKMRAKVLAFVEGKRSGNKAVAK